MKNIFLYSAIVIMASPFSLQAMFIHGPLDAIEKALVLREIQKRGVALVRNEVARAEPPKPIHDEFRCGHHISIALNIVDEFHVNDIAKMPLARSIFEKIEAIEKKSGYIPDHIKADLGNLGVCVTMPTNFLGNNTRYYWLEKEGKRISVVRVEARLTNKQELLQIVDSYKE